MPHRPYVIDQMISAKAIAARVAGHLNCQPSDIFVSSTGVIGVPLPVSS